ncbi:MAG: hypothetical protein M0017_00065 [Desulfobacteraceae bacterium]|nr:hypothetical protein [Desulfobacteraceae bacterium]
MGQPYKIAFLLFLVLGIYYPAIFGGVNSVDDWRMLIGLDNCNHFSLKDLFSPTTTFYYRPLLMASFFFDKYAWGLEPSFMHLENVILHAANTVLVFAIATAICKKSNKGAPAFPLLAAVIFAIHPINTESVDWISGRTDLLGSFFILAATLALIKGVAKQRLSLVGLASFLTLLAIISKEVMLFFVPAGCLLIYCLPYIENHAIPGKQTGKLLVLYTLPFLIGILCYMIFRLALHGGNDTGFRFLAYQLHRNGIYLFSNSLKVFGFYTKKLFIPVPLNFSITTINNGYIFLGLLAGILMFFLTVRIKKGTPVSFFFIIALYLITPAVIIALMSVAWTPVAERYVYLPSAFFSIALAGFFFSIVRDKKRILSGVILAGILLAAATVTAKRNILWQSNEALYRDSLRKSPDFLSLRNELAIALIEKGDDSAAEDQLETAIHRQDPHRKNPLLYINLARIKVKEKKFAEARGILFASMDSRENADPEVLKMLASVDEERILAADYPDEEREKDILSELITTYDAIYKKTKNPKDLYRNGQLSLALGNSQKALQYFTQAYQEAPAGSYYKGPALKLSQKLSGAP